jgi:hypothetical protein
MLEFGYKTFEQWESEWLRLKYDPIARSAPFIEPEGQSEYSITQAQLNALHDLFTAFLFAGIDIAKLRDYIQFARVKDRRR